MTPAQLENVARWLDNGCDPRHAATELRMMANLIRLAPEPAPSQAAQDVLAERARQVSAEGWTPEHDDQHDDGALPLAAASYALNVIHPDGGRSKPPPGWPWDASWWKPRGPRRDLVRAAALLLAEIERIDRHDARRSVTKVGGP
jgi:uncharacterized protein involved in copper resistance